MAIAAPRSWEPEMQYAWFALFAVAAAVGAWFLGRATTSTGRNKEPTHGGGIDDARTEASDYHT
jgi:hypothetical protein